MKVKVITPITLHTAKGEMSFTPPQIIQIRNEDIHNIATFILDGSLLPLLQDSDDYLSLIEGVFTLINHSFYPEAYGWAKYTELYYPSLWRKLLEKEAEFEEVTGNAEKFLSTLKEYYFLILDGIQTYFTRSSYKGKRLC